MSSDEKKVVKLDEEKGEQKSIKPNEKEEEIGLLSKPMSNIVKVPTNPKIGLRSLISSYSLSFIPHGSLQCLFYL